MTSYYIKIKSITDNTPITEPEYWSQQTISAQQKNLFYNLGNVGIGQAVPGSKLVVDGNTSIGYPTTEAPNNGCIISGNVGIGTSAPEVKLHVGGDVRIQGNLTINGTQTIIDTNVQTTERLDITNNGTGPALRVNQIGSNADIAELLEDGESVLCIKNGGNVGIGTTSPQVRLHVTGDLWTAPYRFSALYEDTGSALYFQMMAIRGNGELLAWGRGNTRGYNLGLGNTIPTSTTFPRTVGLPFGKKVSKVSLSYSGATVLTTDGMVYSWGLGAGGGNGDGTTTDRYVPVYIPTVGTVTKIYRASASRADTATYYLNAEGDIYICGNHTVILPVVSIFTKMARPNNNAKWKDFNASGWSIWAWTEDADGNAVYGMGLNTNGQLADGTVGNKTVWTPIRKTDNSVLTNIRDVKWTTNEAGVGTTMFITNNGDLYTTGYNTYGECGIGNVVTPQSKANFVMGDVRLADIFSGTGGAALVVKIDGTLWAWGYNNEGQVGNGTVVTPVNAPVQIRENGTSGDFITNVKSIHGSSAGEAAAVYIIKEDGSVWTTGQNITSALGVGDTANKSVYTQVLIGEPIETIRVTAWFNDPTASTYYLTTYFLARSGRLYSVGYNNYGQLGDGTTNTLSVPTQVVLFQ